MPQRSTIQWNMSEPEQIQHFPVELDRLIDRFRSEYELTYGAIIGTLFIKAQQLCVESADREDGEPQP